MSSFEIMKKLLTFLFILTAFTSSAQVYQRDPSYGRSIDRGNFDSTLFIPTGCGTPTLRGTDLGKMALYGDTCNNILYKYNPKFGWQQISGKDSSNYSTTTQINDTVVSVNKLNGDKTVWKFEGVGTGSTGLPTIESGVYVPVISTPGTNSGQPGGDGGTSSFKYTRINNIVIVSGYFTVVPTGSGTISFSVSLPIASNFTNSSDATGSVGGGWTSMTGGLVRADYTNDVIDIIVGDTGTGGGRTYTFICQYIIK